MPFIRHNPERKPNIISSNDHPVSVITVFNTKGDLRPIYFCIEDDNLEIHKYKIETIEAVKDKHASKEFICSYNIEHICYKATIIFDIQACRWYIRKPAM